MARRKKYDSGKPPKKCHDGSGQCVICKHPMREAIESIAMTGGYSWYQATQRINDKFGTNFAVQTVKSHMLKHDKSETVIKAGIYLGEVMGEDKFFTSHGILRVLILEALQKVASGEIQIKNVQELMQAIMLDKSYIEMYDRNARLAEENGQTQQFMAQIGILAKSLKEYVDPAQLETAMRAAMSEGLRVDIQTVEPNVQESPFIDPKNVVQRYIGNGSQQAEELNAIGALDGIKRDVGILQDKDIVDEADVVDSGENEAENIDVVQEDTEESKA